MRGKIDTALVGDRAIIMFAELLRAEFGHDAIFLGHIGGDDFFSGASGPVRDFANRLVAVTNRFARDAESLYIPEHRRNGFIECAGRDGVAGRFPLLTCSIALLHLEAGAGAVNADEDSRALMRLKAAAKRSVILLRIGAGCDAGRLWAGGRTGVRGGLD